MSDSEREYLYYQYEREVKQLPDKVLKTIPLRSILDHNHPKGDTLSSVKNTEIRNQTRNYNIHR